MFYVIDPGVGSRDLMKWVIGARRKLRIISVYFPDAKDAGRSATIAFLFSQAGFVLASEAGPPCQTAFAEQHRKRLTNRRPIAVSRALKKMDMPVHRIPIGRDPYDKLVAIIRNTGGTRSACQHEPERDSPQPNCRDKHSQT